MDNLTTNLNDRVPTESAGADKENAVTELGKFKSVKALMQAYTSLQAEFTRRSQRLKELELMQKNECQTQSLTSQKPMQVKDALKAISASEAEKVALSANNAGENTQFSGGSMPNVAQPLNGSVLNEVQPLAGGDVLQEAQPSNGEVLQPLYSQPEAVKGELQSSNQTIPYMEQNAISAGEMSSNAGQTATNAGGTSSNAGQTATSANGTLSNAGRIATSANGASSNAGQTAVSANRTSNYTGQNALHIEQPDTFDKGNTSAVEGALSGQTSFLQQEKNPAVGTVNNVVNRPDATFSEEDFIQAALSNERVKKAVIEAYIRGIHNGSVPLMTLSGTAVPTAKRTPATIKEAGILAKSFLRKEINS